MPGIEEYLKTFDLKIRKKYKDKLLHYADILFETSKKFNLTGLKTREDILLKLVVESLLFFKIKNHAELKRICDIGSGAGIPGIPIAICAPGKKVFLVESVKKKVAFLKRIKVDLSLDNVAINHERAENLGRENRWRERFDCSVARALGPIEKTCELCSPFIKTLGTLVVFTGSEKRFRDKKIKEKLKLKKEGLYL